jgi:hypothetical protein
LDIKNKLLCNNNAVYIIWDEATLPIIRCELFKVIDIIDYITSVSFDTWIFSIDEDFVIEIFHDGKIQIGFDK